MPDNDPDYKPGVLFRELKRLSGSEGFQLREILISDSISGKNGVNGKFFEVVCNEKSTSKVYIGRVYSCRAGGCINHSMNDMESGSEYFDYFILFDLHNKITAVRVYNYAATHGQEITGKGWLNQFMGFDGNRSLRVGKEIDSISGATISVNGLVADVLEKTAILRQTILIY
jgi:Na+-translocating ferredoxin:NAD+ oxidoreductase RnfG subunit